MPLLSRGGALEPKISSDSLQHCVKILVLDFDWSSLADWAEITSKRRVMLIS